MGTAGIAPKESETPKKPVDGENAEEKTRATLDHASSVVSIAALFATGFGVWSVNSLTEKLLTALVVVSLSGAIIAGIGAWRNLRRFVFTAIFFVACSAFSMALVAVEVGAANPQPASALGPSPSTHTASTGVAPTAAPSSNSSAPASHPASAGPSGSASSDASSDGYTPEFSQNFTINGYGCNDANNVPFVTFSGQAAKVTSPNDTPIGTSPDVPWDIDLGCGSGVINFNGQSAVLKQKPSPEACENQINSYPGPATYDFSSLKAGMQFCLLGSSNNVIFLKLIAVSDASYATTWSATAWAVPGGN